MLTLGKFPELGLEGWEGHVELSFPLPEAGVRRNLERCTCSLSSLLELSQSQDKIGMLAPACLPALPPRAIPYMALVSLTGNMFLGMKFIFKQLFKQPSENVLFCFTEYCLRVTGLLPAISLWTCVANRTCYTSGLKDL